MSDSPAVLYAQDGGVVTLTLNQPDTRNAISPEIVEALTAACDRVNVRKTQAEKFIGS